MSHKCGPGCRRKQTPSTRTDCPSCGSSERAERTLYAHRAIANPIKPWRLQHPDVDLQWVEAAIV